MLKEGLGEAGLTGLTVHCLAARQHFLSASFKKKSSGAGLKRGSCTDECEELPASRASFSASQPKSECPAGTGCEVKHGDGRHSVDRRPF